MTVRRTSRTGFRTSRTRLAATSRSGPAATSRTRLAGAAVTAVLAALSLTACDDGTGAQDEGAATTVSANPSATSASSGSSAGSSGSSGAAGSGAGSSDAKPDAVQGGAQGGTQGGGQDPAPADGDARPATHTPATKPPASSGKPVTCEGSVTRTVAAPLNRPVNHMLLTVTNTGSRTCYLYGYPAVRFGEAQAVPPVVEDSHPQAVVTLAPGESGYASVKLSATDGSAAHGHTETSLTVYFQGRSGNESVGKGATPALPDEGVYVDDSLEVTYWQQSMDDAVSW